MPFGINQEFIVICTGNAVTLYNEILTLNPQAARDRRINTCHKVYKVQVQ